MRTEMLWAIGMACVGSIPGWIALWMMSARLRRLVAVWVRVEVERYLSSREQVAKPTGDPCAHLVRRIDEHDERISEAEHWAGEVERSLATIAGSRGAVLPPAPRSRPRGGT